MNFNTETPTEIITPYKVVLIAIISNYCHIVDRRFDWAYDIRDLGDVDREKKRKFYMSLLTWTYRPEGCIKSILRGVESFSKILHDSVVRKLRELCCSPSGDTMDVFFANFSYLFGEPCLPNILQLEGALALFGRRLALSYERMDYSELQRIQKELTKYCGFLLESKKNFPRLSSDKGGNVDDSDSIDDMELESQSEMDSKSSDGSTRFGDLKPSDLKSEVKVEDLDASDIYTVRQADFFCTNQAALITDKETLALPPDKLQDKISQMLRNNPELTEVHYLGYLNCMRIKEFCGAVDHLLTYFNKNAKLKKSASKESEKYLETYQCIYAALHLAQFYFKVGHKKAALAATREAVDLCQLAGDICCLQHAMCLMSELDPQNVHLSLLEHQVKPAKEMELIPLASKALLREATKQVLSGKRPSGIFIKLAANEALAHSNANQSLNVIDYTYKAQMASLFCQLALSSHRTGYRGYHTYSWQPNTSDVALSLCHLAEILHESCEVAGCHEIIHHLKHRFPPGTEHSKLWQVTELRLKHLTALRGCKFSEAAQIEIDLGAFYKQEAELRTLSEAGLNLNWTKGEFSVKAERLYFNGDCMGAHAVLLKLLEANQESNEEYIENCSAELRCQIYIYLGCVLFNEVSDNAAATSYLLKALSTSSKYYLHKYLVKSKLLLAQLQMYSSCFKNARRTLQSCFFECLTHGTVLDKSRMKMIEAKCSLLSKSEPSVTDIDEAIVKIMEANSDFERLQDLHKRKDALYYLARLYHKKSVLLNKDDTSDPELVQDALINRNDYSSQFKQINSICFSSLLLI